METQCHLVIRVFLAPEIGDFSKNAGTLELSLTSTISSGLNSFRHHDTTLMVRVLFLEISSICDSLML